MKYNYLLFFLLTISCTEKGNMAPIIKKPIIKKVIETDTKKDEITDDVADEEALSLQTTTSFEDLQNDIAILERKKRAKKLSKTDISAIRQKQSELVFEQE